MGAVRDERLIDALLSEPTVKAAAERCGCARSTVYARMGDAEFAAKLDAALAERRRASAALAAQALELAGERVIELLSAPGVSDDVRLRAASAVFRAFLK